MYCLREHQHFISSAETHLPVMSPAVANALPLWANIPDDCNLTYSSSRPALLLRVNVLFHWLNKSLGLQYLVLNEEKARVRRVICHGVTEICKHRSMRRDHRGGGIGSEGREIKRHVSCACNLE